MNAKDHDPTDAKNFRLQEYQALRKEIEIYLTEVRSQERYTLIAVGVIWAWLIANRIDNALPWVIPIVLTAVSALRMIAIGRHFKNLGTYIRTLETAFGVEGWQHQKRLPTVGVVAVIASMALFVVSLIGLQKYKQLAHIIPPPPATKVDTK
jgi:hypothetical protein